MTRDEPKENAVVAETSDEDPVKSGEVSFGDDVEIDDSTDDIQIND